MAGGRRYAWVGRAAALAVAALVGGCGGGGPAVDASGGVQGRVRPAPGPIPGRYIVRLSDDASRRDVAMAHGIVPDVKYHAAFHGFAGPVSEAQLASLKEDPEVLSVEQDRMLVLGLPAEATPAEVTASASSERLPSGIDRIDAELNPRVDVSTVGVAVIDTGIWRSHEDLHIAGGINVTSADPNAWSDDNGHGTHVAGIIGAIAGNGVGVRGVAPNVRLYAVKTMDATGSGALSWILGGVDWVAANARTLGIQVANMSLTMSGESGALNDAITRCVASGVTFVVAAGNSAADASGISPANHPSVIAVSAIADSDGQCGAHGSSIAGMSDDSFATFSDYGSCVALAAPGVGILSTWMGSATSPNGRYASLSGTSMAAPHVTGAAAQVIASDPSMTPLQVRQALVANSTSQWPIVSAASGTPRPRGGFSADPDRFPEPLVDAAALWWRSVKGF